MRLYNLSYRLGLHQSKVSKEPAAETTEGDRARAHPGEAMTERDDTLRALVQQWRDEAARHAVLAPPDQEK